MKNSGIIFIIVSAVFLTALPGSAAGRDAYEDDDNASLARVIVLNDTAAQSHSFHDAGDEDWIYFYGVAIEGADNTYQITLTPIGTDCFPIIEIYDSAGTLLQTDSIPDEYTGKTVLSYEIEKSGMYYVRIKSMDASLFGGSTAYDLNASRSMAPFFATLTGYVTDAMTGRNIIGAVVTTNLGGSAVSEQDASYILVHPAGSYFIEARATGYLPWSSSVSLDDGDIVIKDIKMIPEGAQVDNSTCPAEALYGAGSSEVKILRAFRDRVLAKTPPGQQLIKLYYQLSPGVVKMMLKHERIKKGMKAAVDILLPFCP